VAANSAHGLAKSIWWQIAWLAWFKQFNGTSKLAAFLRTKQTAEP
jgi:hypothetical protein